MVLNLNAGDIVPQEWLNSGLASYTPRNQPVSQSNKSVNSVSSGSSSSQTVKQPRTPKVRDPFKTDRSAAIAIRNLSQAFKPVRVPKAKTPKVKLPPQPSYSDYRVLLGSDKASRKPASKKSSKFTALRITGF